MLSNLNGWHLVILLIVLLLMVAAVVAVVLIVIALARRSRSSSGDVGAKLKALDRLRDDGQLSDEEYQTKRVEILRLL